MFNFNSSAIDLNCKPITYIIALPSSILLLRNFIFLSYQFSLTLLPSAVVRYASKLHMLYFQLYLYFIFRIYRTCQLIKENMC